MCVNKGEVAGDGEKILHNIELHDWCSLLKVITKVKFRKIKLRGHVAWAGFNKWRARRRWEDNINVNMYVKWILIWDFKFVRRWTWRRCFLRCDNQYLIETNGNFGGFCCFHLPCWRWQEPLNYEYSTNRPRGFMWLRTGSNGAILFWTRRWIWITLKAESFLVRRWLSSTRICSRALVGYSWKSWRL